MVKPSPAGISDRKTTAAGKKKRAGRKKAREGQVERQCLATRESLPKAQLIRFVVGPDQTVVPDLAEKLPGRGLWVKAERQALTAAAEKNLFSRAAKAKVNVPEGLADQVEKLLLSRVIDHINIAQKAGAALSGFDKVEAYTMNQAPAALLEAADGADDGREKLLRLLKRHQEGKKTAVKLVGMLNSAELSLAFGRQRVIHAALTAAPVTKMVLVDIERLSGFRKMTPDEWDQRR